MLAIPYQTLEIGRVHLESFKKDTRGRTIANLLYKDLSIDINDVTILTPPLKMLDYDMTTGRMRFDVSVQKQFKVRLFTLQEYIVSTFYLHRHTLLGHDYTLDDIRGIFQPLLIDDVFSAFVYPTTPVRKDDGAVEKVGDIMVGNLVRFPFSIQGIMMVEMPKMPCPRLRIQHNVPVLWKVSDMD